VETKKCGIRPEQQAKDTQTMTKRKYTKEFQIEALNLAKELGSYSAAARQLGITDSVLHAWKDKYGISINDIAKKTVIDSINEAEELKRLRKENEQQRKTIEILKRAAAFFSQDHLK
jgi:transposase